MGTEIKAPAFPESVADGEIAAWHKGVGDNVARDELIVEIETDKVVMEVLAPEDGVIVEILANEGDTVESEQLLATLKEGAGVPTAEPAPAHAPAPAPSDIPSADTAPQLGPAARQLIEEHQLDANRIQGSGKGGRITKEDVLRHVEDKEDTAVPAGPAPVASITEAPLGPSSERVEKRVPMTRMRAKIAERLLDATQETAMLTTFNEVNMAPVMALRAKYKDQFE
ncbi:MAG: biotin/lipoyl-containing protein, partial [Pseudomonadota bacterium]